MSWPATSPIGPMAACTSIRLIDSLAASCGSLMLAPPTGEAGSAPLRRTSFCYRSRPSMAGHRDGTRWQGNGTGGPVTGQCGEGFFVDVGEERGVKPVDETAQADQEHCFHDLLGGEVRRDF